MTGLDLKLERVAAQVRVKELADAMGISWSRVSRIEAQPTVTDRLVTRYRAALGTCRTAQDARGAA